VKKRNQLLREKQQKAHVKEDVSKSLKLLTGPKLRSSSNRKKIQQFRERRIGKEIMKRGGQRPSKKKTMKT